MKNFDMMNNTTIFTKIINREIPSYIIYEDDNIIAFLDISQFTKGHTLIATKKEYPNIHAIPEDIFLHLFRVAKKISHILCDTFKTNDLNILNNNGYKAGQTIFHFHIHLIPRFHESEIEFSFVNKNKKLTESYFQNIQKKIVKNPLFKNINKNNI